MLSGKVNSDGKPTISYVPSGFVAPPFSLPLEELTAVYIPPSECCGKKFETRASTAEVNLTAAVIASWFIDEHISAPSH
jgi:hypothetical protein